MQDKHSSAIELKAVPAPTPTPASIFMKPMVFQAAESKTIEDEVATVSDAFSAKILSHLEKIKDLISASNSSYLLWKFIFDEIADCLEELGDDELTNKAKEDIRHFFTDTFLTDLRRYINKFSDDYKPWGSYEFEKIFIKLSLTMRNIPLWRKQAESIIYELKNISKFLDIAHEKHIPGQTYDYLFLANFDEISKLLEVIKIAEFGVKYKGAIRQLKKEIILKIKTYQEFNFGTYASVFEKIDGLFEVAEKKNKKPSAKEPEGIPSSFSGILGTLVSQKFSKKNKRSSAVNEIMQALEKIHNQIKDPNFKKDINDFVLVSEFQTIDRRLKELTLKDNKEPINQLLQEIRSIIADKSFEVFYSSEKMAEVFFKLELKCASDEDNETKGVSVLAPVYDQEDNEKPTEEPEDDDFVVSGVQPGSRR